MTDFQGLLRELTQGGVRFIIVGGFAGTVHGSSLPTRDLDLVYSRDAANLARLAQALRPFSPHLRGAPEGLPFQWDEETLRLGLNFTLTTDLGAIDLLGEIAGGGRFEALLPFSEEIRLFDLTCLCLAIGKLIDVKRAAGRPKDLQAVAELMAIQEERRR